MHNILYWKGVIMKKWTIIAAAIVGVLGAAAGTAIILLKRGETT